MYAQFELNNKFHVKLEKDILVSKEILMIICHKNFDFS